MLRAKGVTASFYVAMGNDNSGKAIRRIITNRGFLTKMFRTRAVSMYGWRTILSGTLLKARPVAMAFPNLLRDLNGRGFEVGVHGYDHVRWQDRIDEIGEAGIAQELEDAFEVYRADFRAGAARLCGSRMARQRHFDAPGGPRRAALPQRYARPDAVIGRGLTARRCSTPGNPHDAAHAGRGIGPRDGCPMRRRWRAFT